MIGLLLQAQGFSTTARNYESICSRGLLIPGRDLPANRKVLCGLGWARAGPRTSYVDLVCVELCMLLVSTGALRRAAQPVRMAFTTEE